MTIARGPCGSPMRAATALQFGRWNARRDAGPGRRSRASRRTAGAPSDGAELRRGAARLTRDRDRDQQRHQRRHQVAGEDVVLARGEQRQRDRDRRSPPAPRRSGRPAARRSRARRRAQQQRQRARAHSASGTNASQRPLGPGDDVAGLAGDEGRRRFPEPVAEAEVADPLGVADRHLVDRQRRQQQTAQPARIAEPGEARPRPRRRSSSSASASDREGGEVVGGRAPAPSRSPSQTKSRRRPVRSARGRSRAARARRAGRSSA